jgi:4-hydroxythreonine-4-phosphate dehydrogenase
MNKFIFTCGDTNGIGPEIVIKALNRIAVNSPEQIQLNRFIFICPKNVFESAADITPVHFDYQIKNGVKDSDISVTVLNIKNPKIEIGKPTKNSGKAAFTAIKLSYELLKKKKADAVITAPISKSAVKMAGYNYPGHTEMYAEWCGVKNFVMMFISKELNAALTTIHEPIKNIPGLLNSKYINGKIEVVVETLIHDMDISNPKVAILGLNPHAGEDGLIGKEEINIISPAVKKNKYSQYLSGPFSPDAFFGSMLYKKFDLVIGMYHDQVLIPFKLLNFSSGVNYTAGLPIVRTSPDHGTAFDIAGKNIADQSSILEAFFFAEKIVNNRKKNA